MNPEYEMRKIQAVGTHEDKANESTSFSFIIPKRMARNLGIKKGDYMTVQLVEDKKDGIKRIVMKKVKPQ